MVIVMNQVLHYLKQSVGDEVSFRKWNAKETLNLQIAGSYDFFYVTVMEVEFLLMKPLETMTIQKIKIQMEYVKSKTALETAVLIENSTSYRIKKMLEERIPFIAVEKQMYLPFMALHIRKQREQTRVTEVHEKFTPSTQLLYLYMLYQNIDTFGAEEMAGCLNVSVMTALRGMKELEQIGLVDVDIAGQTGRKKVFKRICKNDYYRRGRLYLQNPVKKTIYVKYIPKQIEVLKGGLYALAAQTMLGEPAQEIYAVDGKQEKGFIDVVVTQEQALEEKLPKIQLMRYNVGLLAKKEYVDPVTLIVSLGETDERIEMAIDELMEGTEWFGG